MFHLAAYYQNVDPAASLKAINAVPDQAVFSSGLDIRVPTGLAKLLGAAALSAATVPLYAQVSSPTLRDLANQDVSPIADAIVWTESHCLGDFFDNPRDLTELEAVEFAIYATGGAAAHEYGLIFLGDGPVKPTSGKIFTVEATAAITLAAGKWVNGALTFNSTLPAGTYQVVGMKAFGANLIAARLVFVGGSFRPGVLGDPALDQNFNPIFRYGRLGVFGQFDSNQPPTLDALGETDTAQILFLDLIKVK
jgi:hypothetical protein